MIKFVSKSIQTTSGGGSLTSKYLESIPKNPRINRNQSTHLNLPIINGQGADRTSLNAIGHNGIYAHCHWNGNNI